jgi:hypothetical protein
MQWVTRKGVKLDRSACAWLVLRHLDPQAEFLYLEAEPMQAAIAAGARPFHNVTYAGPGSRTRSSFEDLLAENGLAQSDPALAEMATFIHAAEIGGEAGGTDDALRAITKGVNAQVHSDQEMVEQMLPIFDALYTYCRRKVAGQTRWAGLEPGWGQG